MIDNLENKKIMPVLPLRGLVLYPNMVLHFDVSRKISQAAIEEALNNNREIFIVSQKDINVKNPALNDLADTGVTAVIHQVMKIPGSEIQRVVVEGVSRGQICQVLNCDTYMKAIVTECAPLKRTGFSLDYETALVRKAKEVFEKYAAVLGKLPPDLVLDILNMNRPGQVADCMASNIAVDWRIKQELLDIKNPVKRLERLIAVLINETRLNEIERDIQSKVEANVEKNQKDYYIREQMKVLSDELGEDVPEENEIIEYKEQIKAIHFEEQIEKKLLKEVDKLSRIGSANADAYVIRNYLDTVLSLPWNTYSKDNLNIKKARDYLNRGHYGLDKVKQRILETLCVRKLNPDVKGQILCFAGPPGVGKTSIAKALAEAMGRKYVRISLGGVHDEAEIRGHRRTYIGAMTGKIISALKIAGTSNPLILFDEIDKMANDYKGDPASAMLEVLDSEQNFAFTDNYLEIPYDLSKVFFITTANDVSLIPEPLYDRMEIIELPSYTAEEKFNIAKKHLIKKQLEIHGLNASQVRITDDTVKLIINSYTSEAGVRSLEREIATLMRKSANEIVENGKKSVVFNLKNIKKYLGTPKYTSEKLLPADSVGIVNGLAWTSVGGKLLRVEVNVLDGSGKTECTGSLGDVMQESCEAAVSYIRSIAKRYDIPEDFYKTKDIHIHFPAGATKKDGPSAGIAIATAILSALTGVPIKRDIAMTGEITLKGHVLPIGGLREKSMGAYIAGVKKIIMPKDNLADLDDVDEIVKQHIEFIPVDSLPAVFANAFVTFSGKKEEPFYVTDVKEKDIRAFV